MVTKHSKLKGITYDMGGEFDQITNYRKNFSNIIPAGNKKPQNILDLTTKYPN